MKIDAPIRDLIDGQKTGLIVSVNIEPEMLSNAAVTVMETSYSPWLSGMVFTNKDSEYHENETWDKEKNPDLMINVTFDSPDEPEGGFTGVKNIGWEDIKNGLEKMAAENGYQFGQLLSGNDDATTHDVMWQFIILGEEVYG